MNSTPTIFLKPGDIINIDGVEMTYEEIKDNRIDSHIFRKHLRDFQESR